MPKQVFMESGVRVLPDDEHNRQLVENVHPPGWVNPEPKARYHLVVIGAGTGGLVAAAGAAGLGAKVALVERSLMGGDCLNHGCVPSKAVIRAARAWDAAQRGAVELGAPPTAGAGDFAAVMQRMRRLRSSISHNDSAARFAALGVDVFLGSGCFVDRRTIEVGGSRLRFRRALIASGARAVAPPMPGLSETQHLTNETIFSLTALPARLGIIGGGPIGSEMAQTFARFGSQVTLFEMAPQILPREDADAAALVQAAMQRDGVDLRLGVTVRKIETRADGKVVHFEGHQRAQETVVDALLVAVGRAPNVEDLGVEVAGVEITRAGVVVDDQMRTTNRRVFACGDVTPGFKFTHTADAQARLILKNALFFGREKNSALVVPWCTYTSPEVAHVGLYRSQAEEQGYRVDTFTIQLSDVDRAVLDGESEGFLRLHLKAGSDKILGATLVAAHAGDMLGELCLAMTAGVGLSKIASTIHPYPTQGEIVKKAADAWRRTKLTDRVRRLFGLWFRIFS